jgi:hypothetical protein
MLLLWSLRHPVVKQFPGRIGIPARICLFLPTRSFCNLPSGLVS